MTLEAVEMALYDLSTKRNVRARFAEEASQALSAYGLDDDEACALSSFDVRDLQLRGASPLLTLGFWLTCAPEKSRAAYLARINVGGGIDG